MAVLGRGLRHERPRVTERQQHGKPTPGPTCHASRGHGSDLGKTIQTVTLGIAQMTHSEWFLGIVHADVRRRPDSGVMTAVDNAVDNASDVTAVNPADSANRAHVSCTIRPLIGKER